MSYSPDIDSWSDLTQQGNMWVFDKKLISDLEVALKSVIFLVEGDSGRFFFRSEGAEELLVNCSVSSPVKSNSDSDKIGGISKKENHLELLLGGFEKGRSLVAVINGVQVVLDERKIESIKNILSLAISTWKEKLGGSQDQEKKQIDLYVNSKKFSNLLLTMNQGVVYFDGSGKIIYANPSAERILGMTRYQVLGKTSLDPDWRSIYENGKEFPGTKHPSFLALKTAKPIHNVVMGIRPGKSEKTSWILIDAIPELSTDGKRVDQVLVTFTDITRQKEMREQAEERAGVLKSIMESSSESIWSIDRNMKLLYANTKLIESTLANYGLRIHVGYNMMNLLSEDKKDIWMSHVQRVFAGEKIEFNETFDFGGEKKHYRININPIFSGNKVIGASFFAKNETELTNLITRIQLHNDRFKEICWIQSHVIRAPVARLMGILNILADDGELSSEEYQRFFELMKSTCREIDDLIRDIAMNSEDVLKKNS